MPLEPRPTEHHRRRDSIAIDTEVVVETRTTRMFVQTDAPQLAWPHAVVPALGLLGLTVFGLTGFASSTVEGEVRTETRRGLVAAGLDTVLVAAHGQNLVLTGEVASEQDVARARQIAEHTRCPTMFGRRDCTIDVVSRLRIAAPPPPPPIPPRWHDFDAAVANGALTLRGEAATAEVKTTADALAQQQVTRGAVTTFTDQLTVTGAPGRGDPTAAWTHALASLPGCVAGRVRFAQGEFSLRCDVRAADKDAVERQIRAVPPDTRLGAVELLVIEEADACDRGLAAMLGKATIEFDSGKAVVRPTSAALLARVTKLVADCPGSIQIEGHTDNRGEAVANRLLSERRAEAVSDELQARGVRGDRLETVGYGPDRPLASNASLLGRARNRRIEMRVLRATP